MKKRFIVIPALVVLGVGGFFFMKSRNASKMDMSTFVSTAVVTKQDISSEISSSGTITPKDTYNITALVSGEIIIRQTQVMLMQVRSMQRQRPNLQETCIVLQERDT